MGIKETRVDGETRFIDDGKDNNRPMTRDSHEFCDAAIGEQIINPSSNRGYYPGDEVSAMLGLSYVISRGLNAIKTLRNNVRSAYSIFHHSDRE